MNSARVPLAKGLRAFDEWLGTEPNFMLGLFFLAIVTSIGWLYQEAWLRRKDV